MPIGTHTSSILRGAAGFYRDTISSFPNHPRYDEMSDVPVNWSTCSLAKRSTFFLILYFYSYLNWTVIKNKRHTPNFSEESPGSDTIGQLGKVQRPSKPHLCRSPFLSLSVSFLLAHHHHRLKCLLHPVLIPTMVPMLPRATMLHYLPTNISFFLSAATAVALIPPFPLLLGQRPALEVEILNICRASYHHR